MDHEKLIEDLKRDEGEEPRHLWDTPGLQPYLDSEGHLTIGYGRLLDPDIGGGLSEEEAEFLLANDIEKVTSELDRELPWWCYLHEDVQRGLANMVFQLGMPRLLGFKKTIAHLKAGRYVKAADECLRGTKPGSTSKWAQQTPKRAKRVSKLLRGPA